MPPKRSSCRHLPQLASLRSCNDHLPRPKLNLRVRRLRRCTLNKIVAAPVVVAQSLEVYIRLLLCNSSKISNSSAVATALCRRMFSSLRSPLNHRTNPSTRHSHTTQLSRPFSKARSDSCKCFLKTLRLMLRNHHSYALTWTILITKSHPCVEQISRWVSLKVVVSPHRRIGERIWSQATKIRRWEVFYRRGIALNSIDKLFINLLSLF